MVEERGRVVEEGWWRRVEGGWRTGDGADTHGQEGEVVAQHGAKGGCRGDVDLGEVSGCHLSLGALAEGESAERQRERPQSPALGELPYRGQGEGGRGGGRQREREGERERELDNRA